MSLCIPNNLYAAVASQARVLGSIIGQEGGRTSPQRDEAVHQDVCGAFGSEFGCGDGEHVRATAKAIREEEDV